MSRLIIKTNLVKKLPLKIRFSLFWIKPIRLWVLLLSLGCWSYTVTANWFGDMEFSARYDDNVNRAEKKSDIREDFAYQVLANGGKVFFLPRGQAVGVNGHISYEEFDEFSGLNNWIGGASLSYTKKFGLGPYTSKLKLAGRAEHMDFHNDLRNSWRYSVNTRLSRRLNEQWTILGQLGYVIRRQDNKESAANTNTAVFDQERFDLRLSMDYTFTPTWLLNFGYRFQVGDFNSTAIAFNPRFISAADAQSTDTVFGKNLKVYRLDAKSHLFAVELNWGLSEYASLNFAYKRIITNADNNSIDYDANVFQGSVLISY